MNVLIFDISDVAESNDSFTFHHHRWKGTSLGVDDFILRTVAAVAALASGADR